jgi:hypothetical protein
MQASKNKRLFNVNDLTKMVEAKILLDNECVELVEGEILERREIVSDEDIKSRKIAEVLRLAFGEQAVVNVKPLIQLYEIQCLRPSIAVINPVIYSDNSIIKAENTFFIIELTESKFNYTDNPRSWYYGLFNYHEVWFVNLNLGLIEVCTKPNSGFSQCRTYLRSNVIKSETSPNLSLKADEILS